MEVSDCICDGRYDKGIDGIYVNDKLGQIDVFQTIIVQTDKGLGDVKSEGICREPFPVQG